MSLIREIDELEFIEDKHYFKVNGKYIPSVSSLIKPISAQVYGGIDEEILKVAAERGTSVHMAIDVYDSTGADIIDEGFRGYFEAYKRFRADYPDLEIAASEYRVYDPVLWFAGTLDKIYKDKNDKLILVDFKTSYAVELSLVIPQLTGYSKACAAHGITIEENWIIHLKPNGTYERIPVETDMNLFISCMTVQNHIKKYKK